jgi:hypothetical protein
MTKLENILSFITSYQVRIFNEHWWKDIWYEEISSRLWPRQKWLTSKIPRTWIDKDTVMEICVLECIKGFVEGERAIDNFEESQADLTYPEHQKKFDKELKEMYQLTTITLPNLEYALERAWNAVPCTWPGPPDPRPYDEIYGEVDRLIKEVEDFKTKIMVWAVENRELIRT